MSKRYNLDEIKTLLTKTENVTDEDLRCFCYDIPEFKSVYNQFGPETDRTEVIDMLSGAMEKLTDAATK